MDCPRSAVLVMEEDNTIPEGSRPLMLEPILFCPILKWMSDRLCAGGVQRSFVVCGPRFEKEVRACLPEGAVVSQQWEDLSAFLEESESVLVLPRAALPMEEAGPGFAYAARGEELQKIWQHRMSNDVSGAELVSGWLPIFNLETVAELEGIVRDKIVREHMRRGVRVLDPQSVYIDPRVKIGAGTTILPGTILRGDTSIGRNCTLGPRAMVSDSVLEDGVAVNDSQVEDSLLGRSCDVGPYAHIRPNCRIGAGCHIGAFVQLKNSVLGEGTKMAHLTYVGDADVGAEVNFGCGTVTCNYDGFVKSRCQIGDGAFIGCNTNLVSPVHVGDGAYIAAGSTVTHDVPGDALAVARSRQKNLEGWVSHRRRCRQKEDG